MILIATSLICFFLGIYTPILSDAYTVSNVNHNGSTTSHFYFEDTDELRFIAIGDWGDGHHNQQEVADAMGAWCYDDNTLTKCHFIISTGDNFYPSGVYSSTDDQFYEKWRDVYTHPAIAHLPWYMTVGNHDHSPVHHREKYQVEFSKHEPRWHFPSLAYGFKTSSQSVSMTWVSIDTQSIEDDVNNAPDMLVTLNNELANAGAEDWKFVFGHHPIHSGGHYGGSETLQMSAWPIMKSHNVDFYLTGHDHNLQHWITRGDPSGLEHITTGAGGESEYHKYDHNVEKNEAMGMDLEFFDYHYGFTYVVVGQDKITVQFVNVDHEVIHEFTRFR